MIQKYSYLNKIFSFVESRKTNYNKNIFTILVGKNGTGKSRLLSAIVREFLGRRSPEKIYNNPEIEFNEFEGGVLSYKYPPSKVIAVSTSPFDRFPLMRLYKAASNYSYLGIRELTSHNFGLAYISKIIGSLIEAVIKDPGQMEEITNVLEYLGFTDKINIKIQPRINDRFLNELLSAQGRSNLFYSTGQYKIPFVGFNRYFFLNEDLTVSKNKVSQLKKILKNEDLQPLFQQGGSFITINRNGISCRNIPPENLIDIIFLLKSGCVRMQDVSFEKSHTHETYSISQASSGEQSVVISILGIASQIEDRSLICIDEPEICLHPEWQERYIKILTSTFSMFKGCHFIIATHSPQIISNLNTKNSYILSMETGEILNAEKVANHSADFQLANVFNSPGFQNEFLSRIALNIFTKVSKRKAFDETDMENYEILKGQSQYLTENDPVFDLYRAITKMYSIYG